MYFEDEDKFDLAHPLGPKGTQQHEMEEFRNQIATLTVKVRRLQPTCNRIRILEFYCYQSEFDDWFEGS